MATTTAELGQLLQLNNFELFDFEYQFDDQNFKQKIEEQIIDFYYFYEIGEEVPDRFKHRFRTRFQRLIGYYNELHNTTLLSYNPLINYSMSEALEQLANASSQSEGSSNSNGKSSSDANTKNSDYPQQPIAGGDFLAGESDSESKTTTSDNSNTNTSGTTSSNSSYEKTVEGLTGTTYQELITKERQVLMRIIPMIIEELKPCFILVD